MSAEESEMAFENGVGDKPDKLWRVVWWRVWGKQKQRKLRCTDYFGDQQKAWEFAGVKTEAGYEVISVDAFVLVPVAGSSSTSLVANDRFYRHATGFTDGTKYIVRQSDGMITCVQADKIVSAGRWLSVMDDWYVKNNRWIEITKEEASLL